MNASALFAANHVFKGLLISASISLLVCPCVSQAQAIQRLPSMAAPPPSAAASSVAAGALPAAKLQQPMLGQAVVKPTLPPRIRTQSLAYIGKALPGRLTVGALRYAGTSIPARLTVGGLKYAGISIPPNIKVQPLQYNGNF